VTPAALAALEAARKAMDAAVALALAYARATSPELTSVYETRGVIEI